MFKKIIHKLNNAVLGGLSTFIFFVLGFLWWIFDADTLVPLWVLSVVIIVCYLICIIVYGFCSIKSETSIYRLPDIKSIKMIDEKLVFIVEKNDLFSQGSYATIYYQEDDDDLEIVIGLGYIESINSAGYLQIVIERIINSSRVEKIYSNIENNSHYRKSIKIKPSVDKELFQEV